MSIISSRAARHASKAKWLLAPVVALLMASQASAQQTLPYTMDFDSETPAVGPTNAGNSARNTGAKTATAQFGLYDAGWRTYTSRPGALQNATYGNYVPHVTSGTSTGVYVNSGTKSLSIAGSSGHGTYRAPLYVLLPTFDAPVNTLKISFWMRASTGSSSEMQIQVGYVTGTNYTCTTLVTDVESTFHELQTYNPSTSGTTIEFELSGAPANATRIAIKVPITASTLRYMCIDDVVVEVAATCLPVTNLAVTSPQPTSATLSWTRGRNETQWQVRLNGGTWQTANATTHALTGLTPGTDYTAEVRSYCGADDQSTPVSVSFRTPCLPISSLPLTDGFESYTAGAGNAIDPCWYTATVGSTDKVYPNTRGAGSSSRSLRLEAKGGSGGYGSYVVLPEVTTPLRQLMVEFDLKRDATLANTSGIRLGVMTDPTDPSTFTQLQNIDLTGEAANSESHYRYLLATAGSGRLAFYLPAPSGEGNAAVDLDNVWLGNPPSCLWPEDLAVQSIVEENLSLQWYGTASQYEVQLATDENFSSIARTATVSTNSAYFDDLTVGTQYYARVRAVCGSDRSDWSDVLGIYLADFSSAAASGLYAETGTVVLNDMEPHDWSIYTTAVDKPLRSLNPADVHIVYRGYGTNNMSSNVTFNSDLSSTSAYVPVVPSEFTVSTTAADVSVGISQEERRYHTFEYYKTLERVDGKTAETQATGRLEYQTIFNPFSRRPAYNAANYDWATMSSDNGAPCFRGFYKWRLDRVVGGTVYTAPTGGSPLAVGAFVRADQKLYFDPAGESGMEVEFTALWAPAAVRFYNSEGVGNPVASAAYGSPSNTDCNGTERNFNVVDGRMQLFGDSYGSTNSAEGPFIQIEAYERATTITSVFPNGTLDGVEPAYGPVKEERTTDRTTRHATYLDLCPSGSRNHNRLIVPKGDLRIEYVAVSRLRGTRNAFHLDGSYSAMWGSISANGHNLTLGRMVEPMFDDNKGTFGYIFGLAPPSEITNYGCRRDPATNEALNDGGVVLGPGVSHHGMQNFSSSTIQKFTIRLESGYVGCLMTLWGWNSNLQDDVGNALPNRPNNNNQTPTANWNATEYYSRFIMGCDFDRADEAQQVRDLGTDYAARGYQTLDSMLYHEVYKNAKTKVYRPFRVSSFTSYMNNTGRDSVYSDMFIKSGMVGQEIIDRGIGHEEGGTGTGKSWGRKVVDGVVRQGTNLHWTPKSIYNVASNNNAHNGKRRMLIEGGFLNCCVSAGAWDRTNDITRWYKNGGTHRWGPWTSPGVTQGDAMPNDVSTIRMKGGVITGSMFGGGNTYTASGGGRQLILTGGAIRAWVAGGVNGTDADPQQWEGIHFGNTWIYAGGTLHVGSGDTSHTTVGDTIWRAAFSGINGATDGQIFGAGCGMKPFYFYADSTEIDHQWNTHAWKRHRMGRVDSSFVYIADQAEVESDVYGGGNYGYNNTDDGDDYNTQWTGTGNSTGDPAYPAKGKATLRILGGTVGGRVFGGANRKMGPEVDIRMTGGHVKGGIFGGSNTWGYIKKDVIINIQGGTIGTPEQPAIVCGGGLGKETAVFGNVTLNIGAAGTAGPVIHADVYGGSQQGTTNAGGSTKTLIGTFNQNPSRGGRTYTFYTASLDTAAAQGYGYNTDKKTRLNIYSGTVDGNVFGGGFGPDNLFASTYGDVTVNFFGGEVTKSIFGCNDASGQPQGKVKVNIGHPDSVAASVADGNRVHRNRPVVHGSVYGGGRDAAYGSAPDNYTPVVEMFSGTVGQNVFGGGQGTAAVINHPSDKHSTKVLIHNGSVLGNVYGGGNDAKVIGNTRVVIGDDGTLTSYTITATAAANGNVSGGGTYSQDADAVLTATPNTGYSFKQWSDGNTQNPRTVSVTGDATYTAEFEATPSYTISATANNTLLGSVSGGGSYTPGQTAVLTATPNTGSKFVQWSDGVTYNPRYVKVTGPATYTAEFVQRQQYTLTLVASPSSAGSVSQSGDGTYYEGDLISISATPNDGYLLRRWNDNETASPRTISLSANSTYTAYFEAIPTWLLTVAANNAAWGTVSQSATSVLETESATISATPNEGYRFIGWNDGVSTNPRTVRLTQNTTFTAMFEAIPTYTVTLASNNNAYGTVSGAGTYYENTTVTITATPSPGYKFVQWSDGNTSRVRTFNATVDVSLTATFEVFSMEFVDLGLPSQTKWANCNVGATSPEDVGDYFAWGETAPKTNYVWATYAYGSSHNSLTKYNYGSSYGTIDNKRMMEPADDAAYVMYGNGAHVPTPAQYAELFNTAYVTIDVSATENGVAGVRVTSRANGSSIFIPYGGYMNGTAPNNTPRLYTWTNTLGTTYPYQGQYRYIYNTSYQNNVLYRYYGMPIRAAYNTPYQITVTSANTTMGTVSGGGTYPEGTQITIEAVANSGYGFQQWNDGNTQNPRIVTVSGAATYTANFVSATYSTGFESGQDVNWTIATYTIDNPDADDGQNKWCIGSAVAKNGSKSLYVSADNGATHAYIFTSSSFSYAYKAVTLTAGNHTITFDYICQGESSFDYVVPFLCPGSQSPVGTNRPTTYTAPTGWTRLSSSYLPKVSGWTKHTYSFNVSTAGTYYLVFLWRNDYATGPNPPGAIDNVVVY